MSSPEPPPPQQQPNGFDRQLQQQFQPGPYGYTPSPPQHPSATSSMALGLIGLIGILFCGGITLMLSPFAWVLGGRAVREIDANPGAYSGRDTALAGKVMGIIGTVLLVIAVVTVIVFVVFFIATVQSDDYSFGES